MNVSKNNYKRGDHDTRPWGTWEVLDAGNGFCVKKITVIPGGILSLQLHHFRSEHWTIVEGTAVVTLGEEKITVGQNEHIFIPVETKHRIQNDMAEPVVFIEIQAGDNLDENDIVRFEDNYGRAGK